MTDMNKINEEIIRTTVGDYKYITRFEEVTPMKDRTIYVPGCVLDTDGSANTETAYDRTSIYGSSYAVTEDLDKKTATVIRRIYGVPKKKYMDGETIQKIYGENREAIAAVATDYCKKATLMEFLWELHKTIVFNAGAVLGKGEIAYGTCRSRWKGDSPHILCCQPLLSEGRVSVPLRLESNWSFGIGSIELWLDNGHPAANIRKLTGCHRYTSAVAYRRSDDKGIDLGNSRWPKGLPETAENVGKVIDLYGSEIWDDVLFQRRLSEEAILKAVARS